MPNTEGKKLMPNTKRKKMNVYFTERKKLNSMYI